MGSSGLTAMVLAAGVGSRLDPLTRQFPKPMVPFGNRPVMEHLVNLVKRHGFTRTVSNVHYLPDKVTRYFGDGAALGIEMHFVHERELTGDAGGVRACRSFLQDGTFIVVMGDLITDLDLTYVVKQHKDKGALATVALKQVIDVERFGVAVLDRDGRIQGFQEKPAREEALSNLVSAGVYVFEPEIFQYLPEAGPVGFGRNIFPMLVQKGLPIFGVEVWGYWSDIGTISQYRTSTADALNGMIDLEILGEQIPQGWLGEKSTISEQTQITGPILVGRNSRISDSVRINGYAVIGDNCIIEPGAELQDAIIWSGSVIGANSMIRNSVIGADCLLPAGSQILDTAVIEPSDSTSADRISLLA